MELIPVISAIGGAAGMFLTLFKTLRSLKQENKRLALEVKDLSAPMVMQLQAVNELQDLVQTIFDSTNASRFLILVATNGVRPLRQCTVIYEQHMVKDEVSTSLGASGRYVNFVFDQEYKNMLQQIEYQGPADYTTESMPECDLKEIYTAEKVTASKVFFLHRTKIDQENDRVWYCSIATHVETGFESTDDINVRTQIGQIQHLLREMQPH